MLFHAVLNRMIQLGTLTVHYPGGRVAHYGNGEQPQASVMLRSPRAVRRLLLNPSLAAGELYMDGEMEPLGGSLYELLDVLTLNLHDGGGHLVDQLLQLGRLFSRRLGQLNLAGRARRNVAHHYDLNGRLYALFLDRDRQYSCAYFRSEQDSLEDAQQAKLRHIAAKLCLQRPEGRPPLEVLDIGCGWGGMAMHLAREWGVRVTGITLSEEQLAVARQRAAEVGLADRVRFELMDYRAWTRPVDRVVSVGMFEHVGLNHYGSFFGMLKRVLAPDGVALVHSIGRYAGPSATSPWITKYIFPGGYCPALSEVLPAVERSGLWLTDVEILRLHYAETLRHWRRRFAANRDAIAGLYDERFCRMFEFYLAASELAFRNADHMNFQLQLSPSRKAVPLVRDYMAEAEREAARRAKVSA